LLAVTQLDWLTLWNMPEPGLVSMVNVIVSECFQPVPVTVMTSPALALLGENVMAIGSVKKAEALCTPSDAVTV